MRVAGASFCCGRDHDALPIGGAASNGNRLFADYPPRAEPLLVPAPNLSGLAFS
jgi:hypothetical protein